MLVWLFFVMLCVCLYDFIFFFVLYICDWWCQKWSKCVETEKSFLCCMCVILFFMYTCLESALQRRVNVRVCFKLYIIYGWIWTYKNDNVKHTRLATWSKSHCRPDCTWFTTIQKHTKIEAAFDCLSLSMYTAFGTV